MTLLSAKDTSTLLSILFSKNGDTFDDSAKSFVEHMSPSNLFAAGCFLLHLIEGGAALSTDQRLVAEYLLATSTADLSTLFLPVLIKVASCPSRPLVERAFICQLLAGARNSLADKAPRQYMRTFIQYKFVPPSEDQLQHIVNERDRPADAMGSYGEAAGTSDAPTSVGVSARSHESHSFHPPFLRPSPPVLPPMPGELGWLHYLREPQLLQGASPSGPTLTSASTTATDLTTATQPPTASTCTVPASTRHPTTELTESTAPHRASKAATNDSPRIPPHESASATDLTDVPSSSSWQPPGTSATDSLMGLLTQALQVPLLPSQQRVLLSDIQHHNHQLQQCGISANNFPLLVEHNPSIASEVLYQLLVSGSGAVDDLLLSLLRMNLSLHSMEVVNKLSTTVELPCDLMQLYVSNCIANCQKETDTPTQNRLVRLVCVFLQRLIRDGVVSVEDIFIEVQAFCIEFSRIPEAVTLFQWIKMRQSGGHVSTSSSSAPHVTDSSSSSSSNIPSSSTSNART